MCCHGSEAVLRPTDQTPDSHMPLRWVNAKSVLNRSGQGGGPGGTANVRLGSDPAFRERLLGLDRPFAESPAFSGDDRSTANTVS